MGIHRKPWLIVPALVLLSACGSPSQPSGGGPSPVGSLTLECPSDIRVADVTTPTSAVSYSTPGHTGGVDPIAIVCTPGSGAAFPIGSTSVTCSASDAAIPARAATCGFSVLITPFITPVPTIGATKFLAFGDSLTLGENGCSDDPCTFTRPAGHEYPAILRSALANRYVRQDITMQVSGAGGETAGDGANRIRGVLAQSAPDVLLLLEGVNDFFPANARNPAGVIAGLRESIRHAKAAGVKYIFVSNLPPEIPGGRRAWAIPSQAPVDYLALTNPMIRDLAIQEGAFLIDAYSALAQNIEDNISSPSKPKSPGDTEFGDGLHLTFVGSQVLANLFFTAIQQQLEVGAAAARIRR